MFRFLMMLTSLMAGLALAQLTKDRAAEDAPEEGDAPEGADAMTVGEAEEGLVAVMAELPAAEGSTAEGSTAEGALEDVDEELAEPPTDAAGRRRIRSLAIAGVAAVVGLGIGYLAIRRIRPDLLTGRRTRFAVLEGRSVNGVAPAVRAAVASVVASALATSLVARVTRR